MNSCFARELISPSYPIDWQKRGIGVLWETYDKAGTNLLTGKATVALRRRVRVEFDLPLNDDYSTWIRELIDRELVVSA